MWGDNYLAGQQIDNSSETGLLSAVRITEANVVFKNLFDNDRISAKVGRQSYDGGTIFKVGPRDLIWSYLLIGVMGAPYGILAEAGMDGVVATYDNKENFKVDAGYSKIVNENTPSSSKINVAFINANYKFNDMWKLQGYLYDSEMANVGPSYVRFEYLGFKPEFAYKNWTASAEVVKCFGDDDGSIFSDEHTKDGYRARFDVAYKMNDLKFRGMYVMTGMDFWVSPMQNNYLGLIFTAMSRQLSLSGMPQNVYMDCMNIGADYTINKFDFSADYFRIGLPRDETYKMYEIDFIAKYNYTENVAFKGALGYFSQESSSNYDMIYFLGLDYKFGSK
ncbi:MAG: hypothetical protein PHT24_04010, partial [Endomicrobiaceae bacterium]|nr:hypothetical protein [Endomicrobiaceae bacterium]